MALDASIILQGRAPQFDDPQNVLAKRAQIQALEQQNALAQLKTDEYQRGIQNQNALADAYRNSYDQSGNLDRQKLTSSLAQGGQGAQIPVLQKQFAEQDKVAAESQKASLEQAIKKQAIVSQYAGSARDQASWDQGLSALQSMGIDITQVPKQFDPQTAESLRNRALTGQQQLEQKWKEMSFTTPDANARLQAQTSSANNAATNATSLATNANTVNATIRGQDKPQVVQSDTGPIMVNPNNPASSQPVMVNGVAAGPKLKDIPASVNSAIVTNTQNLSKVQAAIKLASGENVGELKGDKEATGWKGYLPNSLLNRADPSGTDSRAMISDIGSLVLHDRSGAAVTASESPRLLPFIPLATDDNATVIKKLKRFEQIYQEETNAYSEIYGRDQGYKPNPVLERSAKPAAPGAKIDLNNMTPQQKAQVLDVAAKQFNVPKNGNVGMPKQGQVEGGYRFKGGSPSDPSSWEKV